MSDDEGPDAVADQPIAPRPRPRPSPRPAEPAAPVETTEPAEPPAPVSAASRARRIGGRPVVPAAAPVDLDKRATPPPPGTGRHLATPPSTPRAKSEKASKPPKPPKQPKQPKTPKAPGQPGDVLVAWIPAGVLAVAALVLVVLIVIAGHGVYYGKSGVSSSSRTSQQKAALAASKTCIAAINTYDYRTLAKSEAAALACTTGPFTASLKTTFEKTILPEAPVAKATQTAQINYAGIQTVSPSGTQVQILMYGQLTITNVSTASAGTPRYDPFGIVVTMNKVGSKWLVAKYATDTVISSGS